MAWGCGDHLARHLGVLWSCHRRRPGWQAHLRHVPRNTRQEPPTGGIAVWVLGQVLTLPTWNRCVALVAWRLVLRCKGRGSKQLATCAPPSSCHSRQPAAGSSRANVRYSSAQQRGNAGTGDRVCMHSHSYDTCSMVDSPSPCLVGTGVGVCARPMLLAHSKAHIVLCCSCSHSRALAWSSHRAPWPDGGEHDGNSKPGGCRWQYCSKQHGCMLQEACTSAPTAARQGLHPPVAAWPCSLEKSAAYR